MSSLGRLFVELFVRLNCITFLKNVVCGLHPADFYKSAFPFLGGSCGPDFPLEFCIWNLLVLVWIAQAGSILPDLES